MKSLLILLLCLSLLQNIFTYNAAAAVKYARNWWNRRNPNYDDFSYSGGDCANFVSQCLIAGGFSILVVEMPGEKEAQFLMLAV